MVQNELTTQEWADLCEAAEGASLQAYAPYSQFRIGAAVLGKVAHKGVNVENATYGATVCAERSALSAARTAGEREIRGMALYFRDPELVDSEDQLLPCGICLQWMVELAPNAVILICNTGKKYTLPELLPHQFKMKRPLSDL